MRKNILKILEIIALCFVISSSTFAACIWLAVPRAEKFVMDIHKKDQVDVCNKLDSLIRVINNHRVQTQSKLDKVNFLLLEAIPEKQREKILKKYKEFCE